MNRLVNALRHHRSGARTGVVGVMVGLLISLASLGPAVAAPQEPQARDRPLRVLDLNIRAGQGVDSQVGGDLDRIAGVIRTSGAQIVTLQEVDRHFGARSGFVDQAAYLGRALGMHVAYGPNIDWPGVEPGEPNRQYGTAVLSSFPILEQENVPLPIHGAPRPAPEEHVNGDVSEPRGLLRTVLNVRGVPVTVLTTHLQSDRTAPSLESAQQQRAEQVLAILAQIEASRGPVILNGDLNAVPTSPELQPLFESLTDAWLAVGDGGDGHTAYLPELDRRIDYVLATPDITIRSAEVVRVEESDHLPVVVELTVPGTDVGVGRR